jgi:hypothetical protein
MNEKPFILSCPDIPKSSEPDFVKASPSMEFPPLPIFLKNLFTKLPIEVAKLLGRFLMKSLKFLTFFLGFCLMLVVLVEVVGILLGGGLAAVIVAIALYLGLSRD